MDSNKSSAGQVVEHCYLCGGKGYRVFTGMQDRLFGVPGRWDYKCCNDCGLIWLTPWPENLNDAYRCYYTHRQSPGENIPAAAASGIKKKVAIASFGYQDKRKSVYQNIFGHVCSLFGPLKDMSGRSVMWLHGDHRGRLLDVGCGNGFFLSTMKNLGWDVYGIEPDPNAADQARKLIAPDHIFEGFLNEAAFAESWFDAITLSHVIEHLPDPVQTLKECMRLLRPGGKIVVTTPNTSSLGRKWFKANWRGWEPPRHLFLFTASTLAKCMTGAGSAEVTVKPHATTGYNIWLFGQDLKRDQSQTQPLSPITPNFHKLSGLIFWITEYIMNLIWPCGEELVLIACKK